MKRIIRQQTRIVYRYRSEIPCVFGGTARFCESESVCLAQYIYFSYLYIYLYI
jgi:hypothetical protein